MAKAVKDKPLPPVPEGTHWFCLRTKRFSERPCATLLRVEMGIDVYCPMISFEKARRTGKVWVTEALFPNYLFAKFDFADCARRIKAVRGILKIVEFGGSAHPVPPRVISELKEASSGEETILIPTNIVPGEEVKVLAGPFQGLQAMVTRLIPSKDRVAILLELLGGEQEVEIATAQVMPDIRHPMEPHPPFINPNAGRQRTGGKRAPDSPC